MSEEKRSSNLKFAFGSNHATSSSGSSLGDPKRSLTKIGSMGNSTSSANRLSSPGTTTTTKLPVIKRSGTYVIEGTEGSTPSKSNGNALAKTAPAVPVRPVITSANENLRVAPGSKVVVSNRASNLAAFKQQKRAELAKAADSTQYFVRQPLGSEDSPSALAANKRSLNQLLKNAKKTGILNLSSYDLSEGRPMSSILIDQQLNLTPFLPKFP